MSSSQLTPVAFDIETSGFDTDAVITVAGFAHGLGESLFLNTGGHNAVDRNALVTSLDEESTGAVQLEVVEDEAALLEAVSSFVTDQLDGDTHYVTAFNGATWSGGFDLPFCRTRSLQHELRWPFGGIAYADMIQLVDRFNTHDHSDLVGVYDVLVGEETCDPFDDNAEAVDAFERGEWLSLCQHNLADIQRTRKLAELAGQFVARSDFKMKNLQPPRR